MEGGNNRNIFPSSNPFNSTLLTLGSGQGTNPNELRPPPANLLNQGTKHIHIRICQRGGINILELEAATK